VAHAYDATRGLPAEAGEYVADTIVKLAGATPETRFVEPGIGTGRIALPLVRRGYRYVGVDVSEKMLAELRRKLADAPEGAVDRLRLLQGDATALPFEDASFDAAVSAHVLHLIPAWRRALAEVRRVLEPEGVFLYCHQEWDENGPRASFSETWRAILASYGVDASVPGAGKTEVRGCPRRTAVLDVRPVPFTGYRAQRRGHLRGHRCARLGRRELRGVRAALADRRRGATVRGVWR
jgi:ubiquinone/menaquinone biosynthesis C-methylase UbiE